MDIKAHGYDLATSAGDGGSYRLHGKSASKGKHAAVLDQAVADMEAGLHTVLVVWQSSRIERRGAWNAFDLAGMSKRPAAGSSTCRTPTSTTPAR